MADKLLEIKDLEVLYKSGKNPVHAVNGISLTLNKGETCLLYTSDAADE